MTAEEIYMEENLELRSQEIQCMKAIADALLAMQARLESWDAIYTTKDGRQLHSIKATANVYTQGR